MTLRLHRVRRVSTDNKGQDLDRQLIATDAWAQREGAQIVGDTPDEGTSATFTMPFERRRFVEACETARATGCAGLIAESVDRVCGGGSDELGWVRYELRRRYGLELYFADVPLALHGTLGGNVSTTASAEVRRERIAVDRRRIREGIQTRRQQGKPVGGQTQQKVTPELVELVQAVRQEHADWSLRRIAHEVSTRRGANTLSLSEKERNRRRVTYGTIRNVLKLLNGPTCEMDPPAPRAQKV